MADPFSIAASAAGVLSLGLSACNGLLKYYSAYKNSGSAVSTMYSQLLSLTKTLTLIEGIMHDEQAQFDRASRKRLDESLESCRIAAETLEKKLKKVTIYSEPEKVAQGRPNIRGMVQKASFPFRESTLIKLKEIMTDFRGDLILVLDVLQM